MPELPEVETLSSDLRRLLVGAVFGEVELLWPRSIATPTPEEFICELPGHEILDVGRRGKFVSLTLSASCYLLIHLRMSGRLRVRPPGSPIDKHARVVFRLADKRLLLFSDVRKFGRVYLTADPSLVIRDLGPEPLAEQFTLDDFAARVSSRKGTLKSLLLRQAFLAGLGNIYVDEALFAAGLHPLRKANTLSQEEIRRLYTAIRDVLREAIEDRGSTLDDESFVDADGRPGSHQGSLRVYRRQGEPCFRCGAPIQRVVLGQRGTHFCPECQK